MDVKHAAEALDTDPKKLRQFLRSDARYKSPGAGGRYDLSGFSVDELREAYDLWAQVSTPRTARVASETTDDADDADEIPPLPLGASRGEVRAHAARRVERLEERLRDNGLHLSQLKDRASWASVSKPRTSR